MKFLSKKGLSMSQAQSVANLCYQRGIEITNRLSAVNNAEKSVKVDGEQHIVQPSIRMPENVTELIIEKAKYHATQGFLMEAIKSKEKQLDELQSASFNKSKAKAEVPTLLDVPDKPELPSPVKEDWGWEQLTDKEWAEYLEVESYAAHIGQFIHSDSKLDNLRKQLDSMSSLEWFDIEAGKRTPVKVIKHHTSEELLKLHEELAAKHREYEQRVNYYKAKVKNLVTEKNAQIAKERANILNAWNAENKRVMDRNWILVDEYDAAILKEKEDFEAERQAMIQEVAALRIDVDPRFQPVIDELLLITGEDEA